MSKKSAVLLGVAIGDALGMQFETKRYSSPLITGWDGKSYGTNTFHKCKAGETTDDTGMSIALAESLIENKGFNQEAVLKKYLAWYDGPDFRGAGANTTEVLFKIKLGAKWQEATSKTSYGNGTIMRVSPIGVWYRDADIGDELFKASALDAMLTHNTIETIEGSRLMVLAIVLLLNNRANNKNILRRIIDGNIWRVDEEDRPIHTEVMKNIIRAAELFETTDKSKIIENQQILGAKYTVMETLARALYVFAATDSFPEAIEMAIRGGGDTDTAAACVGALAGAFYGLESIPDYLIEPLIGKEYIMELDRKLWERK